MVWICDTPELAYMEIKSEKMKQCAGTKQTTLNPQVLLVNSIAMEPQNDETKHSGESSAQPIMSPLKRYMQTLEMIAAREKLHPQPPPKPQFQFLPDPQPQPQPRANVQRKYIRTFRSTCGRCRDLTERKCRNCGMVFCERCIRVHYQVPCAPTEDENDGNEYEV